MEGERACKKELHRVNLDNDGLRERLRFIEQRYQGIVQKLGVSQEDIQEIEEQVLHQEDDEA